MLLAPDFFCRSRTVASGLALRAAMIRSRVLLRFSLIICSIIYSIWLQIATVVFVISQSQGGDIREIMPAMA